MTCKHLKSIFIIFFIIIIQSYSYINLKGFVPPEINVPIITYHYQKIYKILAPNQKIDQSPISIQFFLDYKKSSNTYSLPEWGGGGAIGKDKIIVQMDKKPFLDHNPYQVTIHELVHIVISRICDGFTVPRWFHEGLAMMLSGEITNRENIVMSRALFTGSLLSLQSIDSVNYFNRFNAELAYCQSRQAIRYLINTYGMEVIADIIAASNNEGTFQKGLFTVLHHSEKELEKYYRNYIYAHHGKFFWLFDAYLLWGAIVVLFLIGYILTLLRIRKKKQALEREEQRVDSE